MNTNDTSSNLGASFVGDLATEIRLPTFITHAPEWVLAEERLMVMSSHSVPSTTRGTPGYTALGVRHLREDTGSLS